MLPVVASGCPLLNYPAYPPRAAESNCQRCPRCLMPSPARTRREPWLMILSGLVCLFCILQAWCPLPGSDDFWAHAAVGRWIWQNGQVPDHSLFLWTASEPWVAHSWLGELALYHL